MKTKNINCNFIPIIQAIEFVDLFETFNRFKLPNFDN
jgi:hypothetical protein